MVTVNASLELTKLPKNITIEIPKEYCNRKKFMERIEEVLFTFIKDNSKIRYEVIE